jgi:hypothetical protein
VLTVVATQVVQGHTFTVLHNFTGGPDGATPYAGLTMGKAANIYATAYSGGVGYGTVLKLGRSGSGWVVTPLYKFTGGNDPTNPLRFGLAEEQ